MDKVRNIRTEIIHNRKKDCRRLCRPVFEIWHLLCIKWKIIMWYRTEKNFIYFTWAGAFGCFRRQSSKDVFLRYLFPGYSVIQEPRLICVICKIIKVTGLGKVRWSSIIWQDHIIIGALKSREMSHLCSDR